MNVKNQIQEIQEKLYSHNKDTVLEGLSSLAHIMKNRSDLISVCNELKDSRCIHFFPANTSNDELEIHVQISRHGVLDYQGGYWENKTHKVPGIFAEVVTGIGNIYELIPAKYNLQNISFENRLLYNYWLTENIDLTVLEGMEEGSWAFHPTTFSLQEIRQGSSWVMEAGGDVGFYDNKYIFQGGYGKETILYVNGEEFSSKVVDLLLFTWMLILYRGCNISMLGNLPKKSLGTLISETLEKNISAVVPNIKAEHLRNLISQINRHSES